MEKRFINGHFDKLPDDQKLLIILSSQQYLENKDTLRLAEISLGKTDWEKEIEIFFNSGLSAIVFFNLKQAGLLHLVPQKYSEKLEQLYHSNAARNLLIIKILNSLSEMMKKNGKEFVLMQGTALITSVYEKPALRYLSDIDIFIKADETIEVGKLLIENGFKCSNFPGDTEWCLKNLNHLPHYYYPDFGSPLEVHFKFADIFTGMEPPSGWFMEEKTEAHAYPELNVPSPENLILSISLHISKHSHITDLAILPRHCCDMDAILSKYSNMLTPELIVEKAVKLNFSAPLYYSCRAAAFLLSSERLQQIAEILKPYVEPSVINFTETMIDNILSGVNSKIRLNGWESFFMKPTLAGKIFFFITHIFPSPRKMKEIYGEKASSSKLFFYYLYRPFYLIRIFSFRRVKTSSAIAETRKKA